MRVSSPTAQYSTAAYSVANQQQRIVFDDYDREVADYEAKDWEGEHRQHGDDLPEGMTRPFDQEW